MSVVSIEEFNATYPVRRVIPDDCWCGQPNRQAEDHICGECPAHCELEAHRAGRPSPRDAESARRRVRATPSCVAAGTRGGRLLYPPTPGPCVPTSPRDHDSDSRDRSTDTGDETRPKHLFTD